MTIRRMMKLCSIAAMMALVVVALGPANWQPRTELGWELEHFIGYFLFTLMVCLAWPKPFVVGGALMVVSVLLEGLQALTPDRSSNLMAALYGAVGVLVAAGLAGLFMQVTVRRSAIEPPDARYSSDAES